MAFDTNQGSWSGRDSAQSLLADIVNDTHQAAEREKRKFAAMLEERARELERERQRRLERERQTARIRIGIEEERCAARERRAELKKLGVGPRKRRTWALPAPRARKTEPTPLSKRLPQPPESPSSPGPSKVLPSPSELRAESAREHRDSDSSDAVYAIISSIPTPREGLPRIQPTPPRRTAPTSTPQAPTRRSTPRRASSAGQSQAGHTPRTVELILAAIILASAAMCVGFYWADNPAYEPDVATYMKAHYKPVPQLDPQKEVGFVPAPSDAPESSTEAEDTTGSLLTGIEKQSTEQNL